MRIDRRRFLLLTAAITAQGCNPQPLVTVTPLAIAQLDDASAPVVAVADASGSAEVDDDGVCASQNARGAPGDCALLSAPSAPHCESFSDTQQECEQLKQLFKPAVAARAVGCLLEKSGTPAICVFGVAGKCASNAFRVSCGDPSSLAECQAVARKCARARTSSAVPRVTLQECQAALAAVSEQHRAPMLSCMSEGCTAGYCFSSL